MTRQTQFYATAALATLLTTSAALANVTALQVWDDWQALMDSTGVEARFEQSVSDGILTINNLTFTAKESESDTVVKLGSLVFQEQGDGSVLVLLPTDAPIVMSSDNAQITINQSHKDLSLIVSGAPKDLTYSYKASELTLTLVEVLEGSKKLDSLSANITLGGISGSTHSIDTGLRRVVQDLIIGSVSYKLDFSAVDEGTTLSSHGTLTDLKGGFDVAIPENLETGTMQEVTDAGFTAKGDFGYSNITTNFAMKQRGDVANATLSSKRGGLNMWFGRSEDNYLEMSQSIAFGPIKTHVDIDIASKDKGGLMDLSIAQLGVGYTVAFPYAYTQRGFEDMSFPEALDAGLSIKFGFGYDGIDGAFSVNDGDKSYVGSGTSATAGIDLFLDRDVFRYTADTGTTQATLTTPELPIGPLEFSVSEIGSQWVFPLKVSNDPAAFSVHERMINLSISDNLWAMFDPDGLLPRGPLTYIVNVSGLGNWLIDPFDEEFQDENPDQPKGELHSLSLNELKLSGAGINLTGAGDFTFDNDDLETFDGIPAPTGTMNLKLTGSNALIDALIEMGLLPADEAIGVRMALSLFTIAGDGDDILISDIVITPEGQVLANGKRLK